MGPDSFVGPVRKQLRSQGEAKPFILRPCADRNPPRLLAGLGVRILRWLEASRRRLSRSQLVPLEHLPVADHAACAIPLSGGDTLASDNPFGAGNYLIAHQAVGIVVALEQCDNFFHPACAASATLIASWK